MKNFDMQGLTKELNNLVVAIIMKFEQLGKGVKILSTRIERAPSTDGHSIIYHIHFDIQATKDPSP